MYYPRSFLRFIVLGLALIALPLLIAIALLIANLERLSAQSERAVLRAAEAGRESRQLAEQTTGLERVARQFLIVDDRALLDDYTRLRQEFQQTYRQLALLGLDPEAALELDRLLDLEARLHLELVSHEPGEQGAERIGDGYASLTEGAQSVLSATTRLTDREIERLKQTADEGSERSAWLTGSTLLIAATLALAFAMLLVRPVRQIDQAIRRMGTADFENAVRVDGPQELRYLGQRLEWLRSRLHDLEREQTRFLRHVSHELKTPLTVVREGAELLRDRVGGELSPEQDEIVRILRENTLQLQKLIENLLRYQQTRTEQSGQVQPVNLGDVVRRVVGEQKLTAYARAVTIDTRLDRVTIAADGEKIRVIMDNLLSNALKFSPRGGTVAVRLTRRGEQVVLDVIDEGPGIDPLERERVFESFYQGPRVPDGRVKGSGLGLAIVREYVHAHRGEIEVRDRDDGRKGAHFRVTLPVGEPAREMAVVEA